MPLTKNLNPHQLIYLCSDISSTDVNIYIGKAWNAIDWSMIWKFDLSDKIK